MSGHPGRRHPGAWPFALETGSPVVDVEVAGGTFVPPLEQEVRSPRNSVPTQSSRQLPRSAAAAPGRPTATRPRPGRLVGATAIALTASVAIQNAVLTWAGAPGYGDPITEVLAFHAEHRDAVAIAVGLEALNLPLLLGFVTGLHGIVRRCGETGRDWSRLAVAAGATLAAVLAFYVVLWDGVVLSAGELTGPSPELELAWQMHAAAFALALPALGTTLIGAAMAAHASGLTPAWQRLLGLTGGGVLIVAGAANLAIADGSSLLFVGMPGYLAWLVWLLVTGVRLVRAGTIERSDVDALSEAEV
ncbi:MAG: DUF4386 family protein [Nocardioides sp.]|nr:DUF4386 family protein [Nocardioides sp.]